jgi:hypothetical protein
VKFDQTPKCESPAFKQIRNYALLKPYKKKQADLDFPLLPLREKDGMRGGLL